VPRDLFAEIASLLRGRKLTVEEQERGVIESATLGELCDVVTPVTEDALLSVDPCDTGDARCCVACFEWEMTVGRVEKEVKG